MSLIALKRPFSARALPGLIIMLVPIIGFFAMGYKMLCCRTAMSQNYELPRWKNWKELFVFGGTARVIQGIWLAPAAIFLFLLFLKFKSITTPDLQLLNDIRNLFIYLIACLIIAAVFMPASVMNYIAEARFKAAFSFSVLKRMACKAYLLGWLAAGLYTTACAAILFGFFSLIGNLVLTQSTLLITMLVLPVELILLWLPGITVWTLLGEAWGKAISRRV
jgi:hypothetical protein